MQVGFYARTLHERAPDQSKLLPFETTSARKICVILLNFIHPSRVENAERAFDANTLLGRPDIGELEANSVFITP